MERHKFRRTLVQLNQHIVLLEKEKIDILSNHGHEIFAMTLLNDQNRTNFVT